MKRTACLSLQKIQDVDEVILQLLNEAGLDGFIKSFVNKEDAVINYDVTGYKKWTDMAANGVTAERMASVLEDLYRLLAYLEDSFIDKEYVLLDTEYLFVHPETGKVQLVVVPCQTIVNEGYTLTGCVNKMFESFTYDQNKETSDKIRSLIQGGLRSLKDLKELVDVLRSCEDEVKKEGTEADQDAVIRQLDDFDDFKFKDLKDLQEETPVETIAGGAEKNEETAILEEIVKDAEKSKNDGAVLLSDAEYMRRQLREDMRSDMEAELTEKIKRNLRSEIENELKEKIWAELSETFTQNMRHDIENELRGKIQAELEEKYQKEESDKEQAEEETERMPYLIRKKTGEIIQLTKQTFMIGKLDNCCDYVIRGNNAISRLHAVIKYREDTVSYFIVDCNSTNHTYLNGRRIETEQPVGLEAGMRIHLALEEFIFS